MPPALLLPHFIIEETEIQEHSGFPIDTGLGANKHRLLISVSSQRIPERMRLFPHFPGLRAREEQGNLSKLHQSQQFQERTNPGTDTSQVQWIEG